MATILIPYSVAFKGEHLLEGGGKTTQQFSMRWYALGRQDIENAIKDYIKQSFDGHYHKVIDGPHISVAPEPERTCWHWHFTEMASKALHEDLEKNAVK